MIYSFVLCSKSLSFRWILISLDLCFLLDLCTLINSGLICSFRFMPERSRCTSLLSSPASFYSIKSHRCSTKLAT